MRGRRKKGTPPIVDVTCLESSPMRIEEDSQLYRGPLPLPLLPLRRHRTQEEDPRAH